jgi:hypothetical protein
MERVNQGFVSKVVWDFSVPQHIPKEAYFTMSAEKTKNKFGFFKL